MADVEEQERPGLERIPSGVPGLDFVSGDGLPSRRLTLVSGPAGSGKTVLALQIAAEAVRSGEGGAVYVTFEEDPDQLRQTMRAFDFEIDEWERADRWRFIDAGEDVIETVEIGGFGLEALLARIEDGIDAVGATRVSIDSIGTLFVRFPGNDGMRREIFKLAQGLKSRGVSPLMTSERPETEASATPPGLEEFVADNVVVLRNDLRNERRRRTFEILKMRGASHVTGESPMTIDPGAGASVVAMPQVLLDQPAGEERMTSGLAELDEMTAGGLLRDSITLVSGVTGTGKTLMAATFLSGAAEEDERCLLLGFEESEDQMVRNAEGWGIPFDRYRQECLRIDCSYPERATLEQHLMRISALIDEHRPRRVAIDSLSALERSATDQGFRDFILTLTALLKKRQVAAMLTSTGSTMVSDRAGWTEVHISTITDSIILLRYVEIGGTVSRAMTILKMRGSRHDNSIREFTVDSEGMHIREPFRDVYGILAGEVRALPGIAHERIQRMFSDNP